MDLKLDFEGSQIAEEISCHEVLFLQNNLLASLIQYYLFVV